MRLGRTTPCAECPWLRRSFPGYLGDSEPVEFFRSSVTLESHMPCHMSIDYGDSDWLLTQLPVADYCAGNLIFYNNNLKAPCDPVLARLVRQVGKSRHVFSWHTEFLAHHGPGLTERAIRDALWPYPQGHDQEKTGDVPCAGNVRLTETSQP